MNRNFNSENKGGTKCPGCQTEYVLVHGKALCFHCKACDLKFCTSCNEVVGEKCGKPNCKMTNIHTHHPRNCLYFLRGSNPGELEDMLKDYDYPKCQNKPEKQCQIMIMNRERHFVPCNYEVHSRTGFCENHYKEYLVCFINRYKIDPADFGDTDSLNLMLYQMVLPTLEKQINETDNQFKERIKKNVKNNCLFYVPQKRNNEPLDITDVNIRNRTPINILDKKVSDYELWTIMTKEARFSNREIRLLMTELDINSPDKINTLRKFVGDSELGEYLKESCPASVTLGHVKQAISDFQTISEAVNFLKRECALCCGEYPLPEMRTFIICGHEFCKNCTISYLEETIQSKCSSKWQCPSCSDEDFLKFNKAMHYGQLRELLSENQNLLNVFETKLLQDQLMKSPYFHRCANEECTNGFEAEDRIKIQCPSCKLYMCINCNRKWQDEHEDKTCQEFELWMLKNDKSLSNLLRNIGIECPKCGMIYALTAGGSLHFDCKACGVKFCGGCKQLFVNKCDKPNCQMTNFHGHHPRNCLYFLRDYSPAELEDMLKDADYPKLQGKPNKQCQFMITDNQLKDVPCNKEVHLTTGMCEPHYKEYLVQFINRYKIDPADFGDSNYLNLMLFQMVLPRLKKLKTETEDQFKERIKKKVKDNCIFYIPQGNFKGTTTYYHKQVYPLEPHRNIECLGCGMKYPLVYGRSLHFHCKACGLDFCACCNEIFEEKCDKPNCKMASLHGHHPRNCLYLLRDCSPAELEDMLKDKKYLLLQNNPEKQCQLRIKPSKLEFMFCGKLSYANSGFCEEHYKEYLVQFIHLYLIDPADFVGVPSLTKMLFQMALPRIMKKKNENINEFKKRVRKGVKENCLFYTP